MNKQKTLCGILDEIRKTSANTSTKGSEFEVLAKKFFEADRHYSNRFEKVWLWNSFPDRDDSDTGIDLMALEKDGDWCAIQCKFYDEVDGNLDLKSISTFTSKTSTFKPNGKSIKNKILVYTGSTITKRAQKSLRDHGVRVLNEEDLHRSLVDWSAYPNLVPKPIKTMKGKYEYQKECHDDVIAGFEKHDRGQMIMACGTGKTFISKNIAETIHKSVKNPGLVLYFVPSISLIQQSMREWSENAAIRHYYIAVCSDKTVSKNEEGTILQLESSVTTDVGELQKQLAKIPKGAMPVIFSTYQSIEVVEKAIEKRSVEIIFCDEAHRTTGSAKNRKKRDGTVIKNQESHFLRVHSGKNIKAQRRLYMTATPRVYDEELVKNSKALYSMNDKETFGPIFHEMKFSEAIEKEILADFKVKVGIIQSDYIHSDLETLLAVENGTISVNEATKLAAVWHGIQHPENDDDDSQMLQRVIAFASRIDRSKMFAGHIKNPEGDDLSFESLVNAINTVSRNTDKRVQVDHIDGNDNALKRRKSMHWLEESNKDPNTCRILSNAMVLSEGVDVPALDGIVFLNPRKSVIDVVQSVGRVMRTAKGKRCGYVILPVVLPKGMTAKEAVDDADNKTFKTVWQVLNALRSHDERLIEEVSSVVLDAGQPAEPGPITPRISMSILGEVDKKAAERLLSLVKSKMVQKVGDIDYYSKYGEELGRYSDIVGKKIEERLAENGDNRKSFETFYKRMVRIVNGSVTEIECKQVIAQHTILGKVFDELFSDRFTPYNPVSRILNKMVKKLNLGNLEELSNFYKEAKKEISRIGNSSARRQNFIKTLYGGFFSSTLQTDTRKHGIVYTPVEIVDFINHSVDYVLKQEFGKSLDCKNITVLDPFTGTGTFIARMLESKLIKRNLDHKYTNELFANEIMLLAYYVATVNIETVYKNISNKYVPFAGTSYTDTLKLNPFYNQEERYRQMQAEIDSKSFKKIHKQLERQKRSGITVIIGNPPYSAGQKNFNENNPNLKYDLIDERIKNTYVTKIDKTKVTNINSIYDSYIRSIRWASDRIGDSGVIAFATNGSFVKSEVGAGVRAALKDEFSDCYVFDLRGNARTQGEERRKEGDNVFDLGSRTNVVITVLVKNPKKSTHKIHYYDIGDYKKRTDKLAIIKTLHSIKNIPWTTITPDKHNDWLAKRDDSFDLYPPMGDKATKHAATGRRAGPKKGRKPYTGAVGGAVFELYSRGVGTSRDVWAYNSNKDALFNNMKRHIEYCNKQNLSAPHIVSTKAKWTLELSKKLKQRNKPKFNEKQIRTALYRPFFKQYLYFDDVYTKDINRIPSFFPTPTSENLVICVPYKFTGKFSTFITDITPDLEVVHHGQCFPLYRYEEEKRIDNITNNTLKQFQTQYKNYKITKTNIFYYIYGILHHPQYRSKYGHNLTKLIPRIPFAPDFNSFSKIGKKLADLHLNFENCKQYDLGKPLYSPQKYTKISFGKNRDKTSIRIDDNYVFKNIPQCNYKINGRTPLEWVVDRYVLTVDEPSTVELAKLEESGKKGTHSGIVNDSAVLDILDVIRRAVYIGQESDRLIAELPEEFEDENRTPDRTGLDAFPSDT